MTPQEEYRKCFEKMFLLCEENGWGDPFSYNRAREIYTSMVLEHEVSTNFSGADGFDDDGECEYKSTTTKTIKGTYNGISVQSTWEKQVEYLTNDKIGKYKNHYFARFDGPNIAELYVMSCEDVLKLAIEKLEYKYFNNTNKKDPRLGFTINKSEIYQYGRKIK